MRKLALSDEILMQIEKPARYIGNELNSVVKDDTSQIRFAMCFIRNWYVTSWNSDPIRHV